MPTTKTKSTKGAKSKAATTSKTKASRTSKPKSPVTKSKPQRAPKAAAPAPTVVTAEDDELRDAGPTREIKEAAQLLKQVSDPTRLKVVLLLSDKEHNVGGLCEELGGQSQPAVSHHLALLRHGQLIEPRRDGKNNIYRLTERGRKLADAIETLVEE